MATFILVPGAWLGGWCWRDVTPALAAASHAVHTPTLTGLGDRAGEGGPHVDLDAHIEDVVRLIRDDDLRDAILVGHSYAGAVVTGVADRVPERLGEVVFLDAGPLPDGAAFIDLAPPELAEEQRRLVRERGDGWRLPMPSWDTLAAEYGASLEGLDAPARRAIRARATDHPFGTYTQPIRLTRPTGEGLPKRLISCSYPLDHVRALIDGGHPWFAMMAAPEWRFDALPTGHWPMFSRPADLGALLARLG
jgi:pimeloyl-ACP methyl ester carboxylesterase